MIIIGNKRREFIGKMVSDIGKAIVTVGLATYFFKEFPTILRVGMTVLGIFFLIISIVITPEKGD